MGGGTLFQIDRKTDIFSQQNATTIDNKAQNSRQNRFLEVSHGEAQTYHRNPNIVFIESLGPIDETHVSNQLGCEGREYVYYWEAAKKIPPRHKAKCRIKFAQRRQKNCTISRKKCQTSAITFLIVYHLILNSVYANFNIFVLIMTSERWLL